MEISLPLYFKTVKKKTPLQSHLLGIYILHIKRFFHSFWTNIWFIQTNIAPSQRLIDIKYAAFLQPPPSLKQKIIFQSVIVQYNTIQYNTIQYFIQYIENNNKISLERGDLEVIQGLH